MNDLKGLKMERKERQLVKALEIAMVYAAFVLIKHTDATEEGAAHCAQCCVKEFLQDSSIREAFRDLIRATCGKDAHIVLDLFGNISDITEPQSMN